MDIINRVKNVLVSPKSEWPVIEAENTPHMKVCTNYVVILALIPAIAAFIGYGLIGYRVLGVHFGSISWGIRQAIMLYVSMVGSVYLTAFVIDLLASTFNAKKDFNRAFSLVAYAFTPMFVGGVFYILHSLSWLASLCGIYSLYLLYIGLKPMMKVPDEKQTVYFMVSLIVMLAAYFILVAVLTAILLGRGLYGF